jgi:hypothetical protein
MSTLYSSPQPLSPELQHRRRGQSPDLRRSPNKHNGKGASLPDRRIITAAISQDPLADD